MRNQTRPANLYALGVVALRISLVAFGVLLKHIRSFLLTGIALLMGRLLTLPSVLRERQQ